MSRHSRNCSRRRGISLIPFLTILTRRSFLPCWSGLSGTKIILSQTSRKMTKYGKDLKMTDAVANAVLYLVVTEEADRVLVVAKKVADGLGPEGRSAVLAKASLGEDRFVGVLGVF